MLFNSITYLLFLAIIAPAYWLGSTTVRRGLILIGSMVFYGFWRPDFLLLILVSASVDYFAARWIADSCQARRRQMLLAVSLSVNIGLLVLFKYSAFLAESAEGLLAVFGISAGIELPELVLPLGISFYTFQTISYTIDVYRGVQSPLASFWSFLSYVMFWPQLVAGPILRVGEVAPQLQEVAGPDPQMVAWGFRRLVFGLFKKVVLADSVAEIVDAGFSTPVHQLGLLDTWTLAFGFGLQIYFDFSGYSEMALGSAALLGIRFPENFNWPYLASNPRIFWKRWHISLSSWIRDYLYLPLSGAAFQTSSRGGIDTVSTQNRFGIFHPAAALFATWFIMGLWHGAAWRFAVWGIWHALLIQCYRLIVAHTQPRIRSKLIWCSWPLTLAAIMLGWIFFRAQDLSQAFGLILLGFDFRALQTMGMRENSYLLIAILFIGLTLIGVSVRGWVSWPSRARYWWLEQLCMSAALGICGFLSFIYLREVKSFIYFQF